MMVSPESYRKEYASLTLKELIKERNELLEEMHEYEDTYILNKLPDLLPSILPDDAIIDPSPEVVYSCDNLYLKEITDLIIEKLDEENEK